MKQKKSLHQISFPPTKLLVSFFVINMLILDGLFINNYLNRNDVLGETTESVCPQACISRMNKISNTSSGSVAKEYFVPLGSGSSSSTEWVDVAGAASTIDTASYGRIKQILFEATTAIPSGGHRIWVRLVNATDKHPVWYSELTTDASLPTLLTSKPISLDHGNKLYQVQMKVQIQSTTNLVQSRIKITTY